MKRVIFITLIMAASLTVTGCESCKQRKQVDGKDAVPKDIMVDSTISDPKTFNLIVAKETSSTDLLGATFEGLVGMNVQTTEVIPELAESWAVDEAGVVWTFNLRRDVKWFDGRPFTADDVVFTFDAVHDENVITSSKDILSLDGEAIKPIKIDDYTIKFKLPRPFAPFLRTIGTSILPKHILEERLKNKTFNEAWGINTPVKELIGTGMFIFSEYQPAQFAKYERNPNYWKKSPDGKQYPLLDGRTMLIVPDLNTTFLKFTAGETDLYSPQMDKLAAVSDYCKENDCRVKNLGVNLGITFLAVNQNPKPFTKDGKVDPKLKWFNDLNFRKALAHAIDKENIVKNVYRGHARPAVAYISPAVVQFHNPNLVDYAYDVEKAKSILEAAGYVDRDGDGFREDQKGNIVSFDLNTNAGNNDREAMCTIIKEDWEKVGIKVNYRPIDFNSLVEKLDSTFEWDVVMLGFTGGLEPHNGANIHRSSGTLHIWNPRQESPATDWEKRIDELLEKGSSELDAEKRREIYWEIQRIYNEQLPLIPLVRQQAHTAYRDKLGGYAPTVWGYKLEEIYLKDKASEISK